MRLAVAYLAFSVTASSGGLISIVAAQAQSAAQQPAAVAPAVWTIGTVTRTSMEGYPAVHISQEELNASAARIRLARTAYLPRMDALAQFNRATRNNVFGALLPQNTLPSISGPVIGTSNGDSVWGSAVGLLINWQPFDFGYRHANVDVAKAGRAHAEATLLRSQLEIATAAADSFLALLAARQAEKAAAAAVESWDILLKNTHALTAAQLRPGADESRIEAERAVAYTQLLYAKQAVEAGSATLEKFVGAAGSQNSIDEALLTLTPPVMPDTARPVPQEHPLLLEQRSLVSQSQAQLHAIDRSWVPQVNLGAAGYARGSGAEVSGARLTGASGLGPNVPNYAVGVNITFPLMDFASTHARASEQAAVVRANQARVDQTQRDLEEQIKQAASAWKTADEVARMTPIEVRSAHTALDQSNARYKAGLAPIDEVAQAQRLTVQAEIDDAIARLNVWRACLHYNAARGDLQPFLQAAGR